MNNKLKEIRTQNSLTQEELANSSGISIRTIQRIEKGLSTGSSHSIKTLANALNVDHSALLSINESTSTNSTEDLGKVRLMNFSILSTIFIPLGNIILPTIIFFMNKSNQGVNSVGRRVLGFQIIITPILFFLVVLISAIVGRGNGAIPLPAFIGYIVFVLASIFIVIMTSMHLDKEQDVPKFFPNIL